MLREQRSTRKARKEASPLAVDAPKIPRKRYALSYEKRKWVVYDTHHSPSKAVTSFKPFPASMDEIKALPYFKAYCSAHNVEMSIWQNDKLDVKKDGPIMAGPSMLGRIGDRVFGAMTKSVTIPGWKDLATTDRKDVDFVNAANSVCDLINDMWGVYGFEASVRIEQIVSWMINSKDGQVPAHLLVGVAGAESVCKREN